MLLRAEIDSILAANGNQMWGPRLCAAFSELTALQFANESSCCRPPSVPCSKPSPKPSPPTHSCPSCRWPQCKRCVEPAPAAEECPSKPFAGHFVPWIRAVNQSNMYGVHEGQHNVGIPLLGVFDSESGCRAACESLPNCTQYLWNGVTGTSPWNRHCYARCDQRWRLSFIPGLSPAGTEGGTSGNNCPVSARRVEVELDVDTSSWTVDVGPDQVQ